MNGVQAAALFSAVLNVLAGQAAHTSFELVLPTVEAYWPAMHWFCVQGTQEVTDGALMAVELYVGVPTGALPQAGEVAVAVAVQTGHAVHTRSLEIVGAVVWYWPRVHVLTAVQMAAVVVVEKFTPSVQLEHVRSLVAEP